jgi:glycosyltransferase involved in cell wall biosynthesis
MARVPVLITSRRWWTSLQNWKLKLGSRFAVSRSSAVLANSRAVAQLVMAETGVEAERVWTITNFADENAFGIASNEERARLQRTWNAPADAVVIGCVSRLDPQKDHATLLRAFAAVRAIHREAFLVLIGDGECRASLETLARELGIGDALHFAGELRTNGNLHRGLDISVLTSLSEGFPNTLVEAMAAGRPVVSTAVGGCVDAVVNGETGLLVPPADPAAFAAALNRLIANPGLRHEFGQAALRRTSESYSAAAAVGAVERMYESLLASRAR